MNVLLKQIINVLGPTMLRQISVAPQMKALMLEITDRLLTTALCLHLDTMFTTMLTLTLSQVQSNGSRSVETKVANRYNKA